MKKKQSSKETPHEIIMDVRRKYSSKNKKKRKKGRLVETEIDLFAEEEEEH